MRWKVWLAIATAAVAVLLIVWNQRRSRPSSLPHATFDFPPFSESRYRNTRPDARYVGIVTCKECHAANYQSYLHTAHSRALADVDLKTEPPDAAFDHKPSGRSYRVYRQDKQFRHEEVLRTPDGKELARLDLPIRYLVGSGNFTRTYLVEAEGFLTESPITWYTQRNSWALSPGYDRPEHFSFERAVTVECLVCHVGRVEPKSGADYRVRIAEQTIGCESCHGPGSHHAEYHRTSKHPLGTEDLTIVNPGKLPRAHMEAICALCHQQGEAKVHVRGRKITDYRPGLPLSDYRIDYQFDEDNEQMTVTGHFEQLRRSACYQKSRDLSCLTCHDPHLRDKPKDPVAFYRQKCLSCHTSRGCSLEPAERLKRNAADNCNACHMPRGKTDIPHIAFTHHRIGRPSSLAPPAAGRVPDLVPAEDNPHLTAIDRNRNLGLAYLAAAFRVQRPGQATAYHKKARDLLEEVYGAGLRDGATVEGLAMSYRQAGNHLRASAFAQEALATNDLPIEGQLNTLVILAEGHLADQELEEAIVVLEKLTRSRRASTDWRMLGRCYLETNQPQQALRAFTQALALNPFSHEIHAGLAEVHRRLGDPRRADEHQEQARLLARHTRS